MTMPRVIDTAASHIAGHTGDRINGEAAPPLSLRALLPRKITEEGPVPPPHAFLRLGCRGG